MKSIYGRALVWCVCSVLVGGVVGFIAKVVLAPDRAAGPELTPSDSEYRKVLCGPSSLSVALARLGISRTSAAIASSCRVTREGVSLSDLARVANSIPSVTATASNMRWNDLLKTDGVTVLFVRGNHYVAVDPRETVEHRTGAEVRLYDGGAPARMYSRSQLEEIWTGDALIVRRDMDLANSTEGANIAWQECYVDKGLVNAASVADFHFSFRNVGNKDLVVSSIEKSCGCMTPKLSSEKILPGESANVEVNVNLKGKSGFVHQTMTLITNDPQNPVSVLQMVCARPRALLSSASAIRFDGIRQGGHSINKEFVICDQLLQGIKVSGVRFHVKRPDEPNVLFCNSQYQRIDDIQAEEVKKRLGFHAVQGDYLVTISIEASPKCQPGAFDGDLVVSVESEDSVNSRNVNIQGTVLPDIHSVPELALISLDADGIGSAAVQLKSFGGQDFDVIRNWTDESALTITEATTTKGKHCFQIKAVSPEVEAGDVPESYHAYFELKNGSVVTVPVTVFRSRPPADSVN